MKAEDQNRNQRLVLICARAFENPPQFIRDITPVAETGSLDQLLEAIERLLDKEIQTAGRGHFSVHFSETNHSCCYGEEMQGGIVSGPSVCFSRELRRYEGYSG